MKRGKKRVAAGMLAGVLCFSELAVYMPVMAAETTDAYTLEQNITYSWDGGYQGELMLTNQANEDMTEWVLSFTSYGELTDLWGATVTSSEAFGDDGSVQYRYTVEAADYNTVISSGETVTIGYTLNGEAETFSGISVNYTLANDSESEENTGNREDNGDNDSTEENKDETNIDEEDKENSDENEVSDVNGTDDEENTEGLTGGIYTGDGYTVEVQIAQSWENAYNAKLLITNTSDETLHNWGFLLESADSIYSLYNASEISRHENMRLFKNVGYNQDIPAGGTIEVGYTGYYEESADLPKEFALASFETGVELSDYKVELFVTDEWEDGTLAGILIENTSNKPIEDWEMEFDSTMSIRDVWGGVIVSHTGNHYILRNADYAQNIAAGETWTVGLHVEGNSADIENVMMREIIVTDEEQEMQEEEEIDFETDTDGDGLPDAYEEILGTDTENTDTDGDGLSDYEELFICYTDPCKYDSLTSGVSDYAADCDQDGIANGMELTLGTDPVNEDSDFDGLSDGEEVNIYHTDPLDKDSDGDTLEDGEEIKIGLDPLNAATNGTADAQRILDQTLDVDSETLRAINGKETAYQLSMDVRAAGYAGNMEVRESAYSHVLSNASTVGMIPSFEYEHTLESMTIRFTMSDAATADVLGTYAAYSDEFRGIRRFAVGYYSEELRVCLPIETQYDEENGIVYADVTKQGTYCLIDMEKWFDMLGIAPEEFAEDEIPSAGIDLYDSSIRSFRGHSYALVPVCMTWDTAKAYCESVGGHLVSIGSADEQGFIEENILGKSEFAKYWIGGYTEGSLDRFKWVDDEYFIYTNWRHGEPNALYEHYVHLYDSTDSDYFGLWNNEEPEGEYYFICEWEDETDEQPMMFFSVTMNPVPEDFGPITYDNTEDYDHDGLANNEEIYFEVDGVRVSLFNTIRQYQEITGYGCPVNSNLPENVITKIGNIFLIKINSDPTMEDTDGDGLKDYYTDYVYPEGEVVELYDNCPLQKGIFIGQEIAIGEITIVACCNAVYGHTFLVYQSYVDDVLDFSYLTAGYSYGTWNRIEPGLYDIHPLEYVSIGNAGGEAGGNFSEPSESDLDIFDRDNAGIYFNREFACEYLNYMNNYNSETTNKFCQLYDLNRAHSSYITEEQWLLLMIYTNTHNYYNLIGNNCEIVATKSWNYAMPENKRIAMIRINPIPLIEEGLLYIFEDSFVFDMYKVLNMEL